MVKNPVNDFVQQFIGVNSVHNRFDIRTVMQPIVSVSELGDTITINESITTILEKLTEHNVLGVEENGEIMGMVTRTAILQYVANDFKERGRAHD